MKILLLAAVTLDGKIARSAHHFVDWSSKEDKRLFMQTSKRAGVVILGNNTFKTFPAPLPGRLHIVLTYRPEAAEGMPGRVEYTNAPPHEIVAGLEAKGYSEAVLTGGSQVNALFLGAGLVDEVWLTVEPIIFGQGVDLFHGAELNVRARLIHMEQLNEGGTLHLRYAVK